MTPALHRREAARPLPANDNRIGIVHTTPTDASSAVIQRLSYDAWGMQRNPDGTPATCGTITSPTTRGFTNQEQVPQGCLVNLNARLYNAQLGRFMSADPVVGNDSLPGAFNRYTYVLNNPLSLTDTSGNCAGIFGCFFAFVTFGLLEPIVEPLLRAVPILGSILTIVASAACGPICAAITAAGVAGAEGGHSGAVLKAFIYTEITAEAGNFVGGEVAHLGLDKIGTTAANFVGQGAVGGISSVVNGGNFGSGFLAAGIGSLAGPLVGNKFSPAGLIVSATLGGVASVLGGGKFANGAVTAAFAYAATASYANDSDPSPSDALHGTKNSGVGQSGIPDRLVILNPAGDYHGNSADFTLQLIDKAGNPITSSGYALEENVFPDNGPGSNSNYQFVPSPNGQWTDTIGFGPFLPGTPPQRASVTQSFTVEYNNNFYPLSTQMEHLKFYDNGKYIFKDVITHK